MSGIHYSWGTANELEFLKGLGSFGHLATPRRTLLSRYIQAAYRRDNWDGIDRDLVLAAAVSMLSHTEGIAKRQRKGE